MNSLTECWFVETVTNSWIDACSAHGYSDSFAVNVEVEVDAGLDFDWDWSSAD